MPTYEYKCQECKKIVERIVPVEYRDNVQDCVCGAPAERKISAPGWVWRPTAMKP